MAAQQKGGVDLYCCEVGSKDHVYFYIIYGCTCGRGTGAQAQKTFCLVAAIRAEKEAETRGQQASVEMLILTISKI